MFNAEYFLFIFECVKTIKYVAIYTKFLNNRYRIPKQVFEEEVTYSRHFIGTAGISASLLFFKLLPFSTECFGSSRDLACFDRFIFGVFEFFNRI
jgi:hypothetical protein